MTLYISGLIKHLPASANQAFVVQFEWNFFTFQFKFFKRLVPILRDVGQAFIFKIGVRIDLDIGFEHLCLQDWAWQCIFCVLQCLSALINRLTLCRGWINLCSTRLLVILHGYYDLFLNMIQAEGCIFERHKILSIKYLYLTFLEYFMHMRY